MFRKLILALVPGLLLAQYTPPSGGGGGGGINTITVTGPIGGGGTTSSVNINCTTCVTSAGTLTSNALIIGGGSKAVTALGSLGTTTTVLHGNAAGAPSFGAVTSSDVSGTTGSGNFVLATSPTLVTPNIGAATATTVNGMTITSNSGTFAVGNAKSAVISNTLTFTGTDGSSVNFGAGGTVLYSITGGTCTNQVVTSISTAGAPTCTTITSAYVNNSIALTGTDINTSNQVTVTHLASALPASQGGTGVANTATLTLGSSNQNWATLGTGIVKNTTTTGAITNAAAADVYGLFTSCTGSSGLFLKDGGTCAAAGSSGITFGTTTTSGGTTNGLMYGDGSVVQSSSGVTRTANGQLTHTLTALGTSTTDAIILTNTTAAAAGAQQVSPALDMCGQGWKTTATAASQSVCFQGYVLPVQGTTNPTGALVFASTINGSTSTSNVSILPAEVDLVVGNNRAKIGTSGFDIEFTNNGTQSSITNSGFFQSNGIIASGAGTIYGISSGVLGVSKSTSTTVAPSAADGKLNLAGATFLDPTATTGATRVTVSLGAADSSTTTTLSNAGVTASTGGFSSGFATFLMTTTAALTAGSTANVPTLTSGPVNGNPTKWIAINDNGTTRWVPAW